MTDRDPTDEPPRVEVFPMAIGHYDHHDSLDVDSEVTRVADLLAEFGGEIATPWDTPMPQRGSDAVGARLGSWSHSAGGHTVVHWVGHGWSDRDRAALAHARSPKHVGTEGVPPERLADHITDWEARSDAGAPWLIVIIDACKSARFVELLSAALDARQGPRRVLLVGTSAAGSTTLGRLSAALDTVLRDMFAADEEIEFSELWRELKRNLPGSAVIPKNVEDAALRRRVPVPAGFSVSLDVRADVARVLAELPEDERRHFVPKAQGAELGEVSWYFEGREDERHRIVDWLRSPGSGLRVVTGRAGSGKSALLGDVLVRSRPELSRVLVEHGLLGSIPEHECPPPEVFDAALHLTGLTPVDVIDRLSVDLQLAGTARREEPLSARIDALTRSIGERKTATTILVDALDEAADPLTVAAAVLRPLVAIPGVRVVVGTRRSTHEGPDQPERGDENLIDALGAGRGQLIEVSRDPAAISRYARRRLVTGLATPPLNIEPAAIKAACDAIAAAGREFLFARLAVHELLARPELLTDRIGRTELLSGDHRTLFASAVDRLRRRQPAHGPLLRALAHARGRGLPMRDGVWAAIAVALTDHNELDHAVSDADISALLDDAAPYLMIDAEHGQTVYRLAHRTFTEHLRWSTAEALLQRVAHDLGPTAVPVGRFS